MRWTYLLVVLALSGCGSSSSGSDAASGQGGSSPAVTPQTISQPITAAAGGTVEGTGVKLVIPPGALSADTTITIQVHDKTGEPNADSIAAPIFELGPDGTTFSKPVPMTLDFTGTPPSGMTPVIAYLDKATNAWVPLDGAVVSGSQVTASTTHFTPFTVVWSAGVQTAGGCASFNFSPCGGDLTGTWAFSAACLDFAPGTDITNGACPTTTVTATIDIGGTITFDAGAYTIAGMTETITLALSIPKSCSPSGTCDDATKVDSKIMNVMDTGSACTGTDSEVQSPNSESGTYTTTGTTFSTVKTGSMSSDPPNQYCVMGNTLLVQAPPGKSTEPTVLFQGTKQ